MEPNLITMKSVILLFPTIAELLDFELHIELKGYEVDRNALLVVGTFSEREIELAINAYQAKLVHGEK